MDSTNTAIIGLCMQEYFLKLFASYREFVELDGPEEGDASQEEPQSGVTARRTHQDDGYLRYECECLNELFERLHLAASRETCWSHLLSSCDRCCLPTFLRLQGSAICIKASVDLDDWDKSVLYRETSHLSLIEESDDDILSVQCLVLFVAVYRRLSIAEGNNERQVYSHQAKISQGEVKEK